MVLSICAAKYWRTWFISWTHTVSYQSFCWSGGVTSDKFTPLERVHLVNFTVTPLRPLVAASAVSLGGTEGSDRAAAGQGQCHALPIKQRALHFPLWELLCLFRDWLPPFVLGSQEQPWRTCQVGDLRLWLPVFDSSFHTQTHLTGNQLYLLVGP